MQNLLKDAKITVVMNAVTAGTSEQKSSVLDMAGFDAVAFIAVFGTVTDASVITLTAYENSASSTSSPAPVAVTGGATASLTASTSSNTFMVVDVIRPSKRYVFADITRTTQNAVINCVIAIQYRTKNKPVTQPTTLVESAISTPEV